LGFTTLHDSRRRYTIVSSAMPGPLTPRHKGTVGAAMMIRPYKPRDSARSALLTAVRNRRSGPCYLILSYLICCKMPPQLGSLVAASPLNLARWSRLPGEAEAQLSCTLPMRLWLTLAGAACVSACTTYAAGRLATADGTVRPPASPAHMASQPSPHGQPPTVRRPAPCRCG
jgi:hypothetical protein